MGARAQIAGSAGSTADRRGTFRQVLADWDRRDWRQSGDCLIGVALPKPGMTTNAITDTRPAIHPAKRLNQWELIHEHVRRITIGRAVQNHTVEDI